MQTFFGGCQAMRQLIEIASELQGLCDSRRWRKTIPAVLRTAFLRQCQCQRMPIGAAFWQLTTGDCFFIGGSRFNAGESPVLRVSLIFLLAGPM
jgi:hypothetical protein